MDVTAASSAPALSPPDVLLLGAYGHADFAEVVGLPQASVRVSAAATADEALERLAGGAVGPELIILAQDRPGVVPAADVERLRHAAPLAGIIAVAGSWCEGELRTGRPLSGVRRLYWHEFAPWWQQQVSRRAAGLAPDWAGPATVELTESLADETRELRLSPGAVVLRTSRWDTADALADALGTAGLATVWEAPGGQSSRVWGAVGGIWEGGQLSRREERDLRSFRERLGRSTPVVALLDFPRHDSVRQARAAGADIVLGKPWRNADLLQSLATVPLPAAADVPAAVARAA